MGEDDFLIGDDEELEDTYLIDSSEDDSEGEEDGDETEDEGVSIEKPKKKSRRKSGQDEDYGGNLTYTDVYLSSIYDDIVAGSKQDEKYSMGGGRMFSASIVDSVRNIMKAIPKNTSDFTVEQYTKELFQTQGHNRIPASVYTPDQPLSISSLDEELGGEDGTFNESYTKEAREQIARFIEYLDKRDLSRDSVVSRRRKQRQLPAFIIFLFASGMYDLILNCPTMPDEYAKMVNNAFKRIQKQKYDIVEYLAKKYEARGRQQVADRVRKMGFAWFEREPAELKSLGQFKDLELTYEDIQDYRSVRPRWVNVSKSITQDFISDMVEVVIQPGKIYEQLKDKTRSEAIADVKKIYKQWSIEDAGNSELADKIIWKDIKLKN